MSAQLKQRAYWRRNLLYLAILLGIWFLVSYGCGILLVEELNRIRLGGFKLGFWFAQQGSIYVFVALIFVYVALMDRLDKQFARSLDTPNDTPEDKPNDRREDRPAQRGGMSQ